MGIPQNAEMIPQVLQRAGYTPRAVGKVRYHSVVIKNSKQAFSIEDIYMHFPSSQHKVDLFRHWTFLKWHIGSARWEHTPSFKGFKSFYGMHAHGAQDYYKHTHTQMKSLYDMWYDKKEFCGRGCSEVMDERGNYTTDVFTRESIKVVDRHNTAEEGPLFLYLAYTAPHTPLQVPQKYLDYYEGKGLSRRQQVYRGMITAADESLGEVIGALKRKDMWEDTLVIYTSDNGAAWIGSNYPLKGGKMEIWEGGVISDGIIR